MILAAEAFDFAAFVLKRAPINAVRHADVKRTGKAAHDVDEILVILHNCLNLSS